MTDPAPLTEPGRPLTEPAGPSAEPGPSLPETITPPGVRVRPMRWWDIERLAPHEPELFGAEAWPATAYWAELAEHDTRRYWVAEDAVTGDLFGWAGLCIYPDDAFVQTVGVLPAAQRRGIGAALVERLLADAVAAGRERVGLEVRADNDVAIRLYERLGFERTGVRRGYYQLEGVDAVIMFWDRRAARKAASRSSAQPEREGGSDVADQAGAAGETGDTDADSAAVGDTAGPGGGWVYVEMAVWEGRATLDTVFCDEEGDLVVLGPADAALGFDDVARVTPELAAQRFTELADLVPLLPGWGARRMDGEWAYGRIADEP